MEIPSHLRNTRFKYMHVCVCVYMWGYVHIFVSECVSVCMCVIISLNLTLYTLSHTQVLSPITITLKEFSHVEAQPLSIK